MTDITELAQREKFEAWFKSSFHPDKTGPYIKDQLYFAWKAAGAELVEALEKAQTENELARGQLFIAQRTLLNQQRKIAELESRTVKLPKPKNSDQGWKIDPEFINKVQDAIGYDDTCECWEGTPSMELVEAVLLAAAGIKVEAE